MSNSNFAGRLTRSLFTVSMALAITSGAFAQTPQQAQILANRYASEAQARMQAAQFWAAANNWPLEVTLPSGVTGQLVAVENGMPLYLYTRDRGASQTISADKVWPGAGSGLNLSGAGVILGIWDGGTVGSHPEFGSRVTVMDGGPTAGHPTWVAGSAAAAGVNNAARGPAFESLIRSYDWNNNNAEMVQAAAAGIRVSNHSYGTNQGWLEGARGDGLWVWSGNPALSQTTDWNLGFYGSGSRSWDDTAFNMPNQLVVVAAGNSRLEGPSSQPVNHWVFDNGNWVQNSTQVRDLDGFGPGFDSLNQDSSAKNTLLVAATVKNPSGYSGPSSVQMSGFSCFGPTDDGRIKPDISAPGVSMFSPNPGGGYSSVDGTSFAAPTVTGGIGLMLQQFIASFSRPPRAATMKAVAIHTADEAGANPGPDYRFGWGQMNVLAACNLIRLAAFNADFITEARLNSGQRRETLLRVGSGDLRVTLCWMDPAAQVPAPAVNSRTPMLVNDLDIRLIHQASGQVYFPYKLDPANPNNAATQADNIVDNVEQIFVPGAPAGNYIVRVSHKGSSLRPGGGQDYSLVVSAPVAGGLSEMTLNPATVIGGVQPSFATVTLSEAQAEPVTLDISTSNSTAVQLPESITVPANQTAFTFLVNTRPVQTTQNVRIFVGGSLGVVSADLEVRPVTIGNSLILSQSEIVGGNGLTGTVTLNSPAPTGGSTVYLASSATSVARPTRNWIVIPAGQTQGTFNISTFAVGDPRTVTIRATRGNVIASANLVVVRPVLTAFTAPTTAAGGAIVTGTVTLNGPAPSSGASIQIMSSNRNVATVPSTVVVPAGQRTATFQIRTIRPSVATPVTITTSRFGVTRQRTITVNP